MRQQATTQLRHHAQPLLGASLALQLVLVCPMLPALAGVTAADLNAVRHWGYQLQGITPLEVADSDADLMVIDYSRDGTGELAFSRPEVATMQEKPDGERRLVMAYLSIGEAEDYRFYWQRVWSTTPPSWLGEENPDWPGNYSVRYWDAAWQDLIFGSEQAYLDHIMQAGFDGVYLDGIDRFDVPVAGVSRAQRMRSMADFVVALAGYARQLRPDFLIVGQNGEELLSDAAYAEVIDGVAKEDLFFGLEGDGAINSNGDVRASLTPLQRFQAGGKPVFVVEYVESPSAMAVARDRAAALGAPLFIGARELDDVRSR